MNILDLINKERSGLSNIYHGINPLDKQGWRPTPPVVVNHALPAAPESISRISALPLQGTSSSLNLGSSDLRLPQNPIKAYTRKTAGGSAYRETPNRQWYDLLTGSWNANTQTRALPLNPRYYTDEYPMQSRLPLYTGGQQ